MSGKYSHRRWITQSRAFLECYPLCVLCLAYGTANAGATEFRLSQQRNLIVDHIVPHRGNHSLFWDQTNWQTLCRYPCHDAAKSRVENSGKDWFAWLRELIIEHRTTRHVSQHVEWLPDHVIAALNVRTSSPSLGCIESILHQTHGDRGY